MFPGKQQVKNIETPTENTKEEEKEKLVDKSQPLEPKIEKPKTITELDDSGSDSSSSGSGSDSGSSYTGSRSSIVFKFN